jgi:hypothetical protein
MAIAQGKVVQGQGKMGLVNGKLVLERAEMRHGQGKMTGSFVEMAGKLPPCHFYKEKCHFPDLFPNNHTCRSHFLCSNKNFRSLRNVEGNV